MYVKILMTEEKLIQAEKGSKEKALKIFTINFYDFVSAIREGPCK